MKDVNDISTIDFSAVEKQYGIAPGLLKQLAEQGQQVVAEIAAEGAAITGRRFAGSKTPDAVRQKWRTPAWLFQWANQTWGPFVRDVAAEKANALCDDFIDEQQDALSLNTDWGKKGDVVWCNPPYAEPLPWVQAAARNAKQNGVTTVMLLNHDHSPEWFYELIVVASEVVNILGYHGTDEKGKAKFFNGRVAFVNAATGIEKSKNSKASALFVIRPRKTGSVKTEYITQQQMRDAVASVF